MAGQMNKDRTPYKFVSAKIIAYYADNGGYCLVAYDTIRKKASQPLARSDIERMVASYDDARRIVGKAAAPLLVACHSVKKCLDSFCDEVSLFF
jgi:hypothetical protein